MTSTPNPASNPQRRAFHLIGIGGAGMSVVAELLADRGYTVSGSDARESATLDHLRSLGITAHAGHDAAQVPPAATVVVSTAVRETNPELAIARERGQEVLHRSQGLALAAQGRDFVAVAGAHGKTSTSAMIATALRAAGQDPSWAVGGTLRGLGGGAHLGAGPVLVAEADESDGSFVRYTPRVSVVTNVEPDHLDHWGSAEAFEAAFVEFAEKLVPGGLLVTCSDDAGARRLAAAVAGRLRVVTYGTGDAPGVGELAHVRVEVVAMTGQGSRSRLAVQVAAGSPGRTVGEPGDAGPIAQVHRPAVLDLQVSGAHMVLNAAAAWITCVELGVEPEVAARCVGEFAGTGRRFEPRGEAGGVRVVDDYAHHPTEVAATLRTARVVAGDGRVLVLFQPHLYSRTVQFAAQFAHALELADLAVVTDVYAAREDPDGVTSGATITALAAHGRLRFVADRVEAARAVADAARPGDLLLTVGAGDVTELAPVVLDELAREADA